jgi:hypothetical protein
MPEKLEELIKENLTELADEFGDIDVKRNGDDVAAGIISLLKKQGYVQLDEITTQLLSEKDWEKIFDGCDVLERHDCKYHNYETWKSKVQPKPTVAEKMPLITDDGVKEELKKYNLPDLDVSLEALEAMRHIIAIVRKAQCVTGQKWSDDRLEAEKRKWMYRLEDIAKTTEDLKSFEQEVLAFIAELRKEAEEGK